MKLLYRCGGCGAMCRQHVWEALEVPEAEERCPRCGRWNRFQAVNEAGERKLMFGKKAKAA